MIFTGESRYKNIMVEKKQNYSELDVIILMAGEGRRLQPLTNDRPKSLLVCDDGMSILEHIVRAFISKGINANIIPIIGHGRLKALEEIAKLSKIASFSCISNPFYLKAGPLVSLWLGLMQSKSKQVLVLNGDTIITGNLIAKVGQWLQLKRDDAKPSVGICLTRTKDLNKDDMKVLVDDDGVFLKAGKDILPGSSVLKSAGVFCIHNSCGKKLLKDKLDLLLLQDEPLKTNFYWHNILNEIKEAFFIDLIFVEADSWHEVDTEKDLILMNNKR